MPRPTSGSIAETFPGCEYSDEEREFFSAIDRYKRRSGNRFPSCRDILNVFKSLGYRKVEEDASTERR